MSSSSHLSINALPPSHRFAGGPIHPPRSNTSCHNGINTVKLATLQPRCSTRDSCPTCNHNQLSPPLTSHQAASRSVTKRPRPQRQECFGFYDLLLTPDPDYHTRAVQVSLRNI
ncbi:hypothetical protein J6590_059348 [Homalodisca vitripennis]|nr:hypothetical protein J6590_059348 [Homalodisca vitripennis]